MSLPPKQAPPREPLEFDLSEPFDVFEDIALAVEKICAEPDCVKPAEYITLGSRGLRLCASHALRAMGLSALDAAHLQFLRSVP